MQRLRSRNAGRRTHVLGRHQAARRVFGIGEQFGDLGPLLRLHQVENLGATFLVKFLQDVRGFVRLHFLDNVRGLFGGNFVQEFGLEPGLQFLQNVCGLFVRQSANQLPGFARAHVFDDFGNIRRVQIAQPVARDAHLQIAARNEFQIGPGNRARRQLAMKNFGHPRQSIFPAQTSQQAAAANVHIHQAVVVPDLGQFKIVHAHHPKAVRVNDLLVHHIAREKDLMPPRLVGRSRRSLQNNLVARQVFIPTPSQ